MERPKFLRDELGIPLATLEYDSECGTTVDTDQGAWIPVKVTDAGVYGSTEYTVAVPVESDVEVATGIWGPLPSKEQGHVLGINFDVTTAHLEPGQVIGAVYPAVIQERRCQRCGSVDVDAWPEHECYKCTICKKRKAGGARPCGACSAPARACTLYNVSDNCECAMPKRFDTPKMTFQNVPKEDDPNVNETCASQVEVKEGSSQTVHNVGHIVEDPQGIATLADVETPT